MSITVIHFQPSANFGVVLLWGVVLMSVLLFITRASFCCRAKRFGAKERMLRPTFPLRRIWMTDLMLLTDGGAL